MSKNIYYEWRKEIEKSLDLMIQLHAKMAGELKAIQKIIYANDKLSNNVEK